MDNTWERSIPFFSVKKQEIQQVFSEYNTQISISNVTPINIGCRNSNYVVDTNKGKYLLRICPENDRALRKENALYNILDKSIRRPELLFISEENEIGRPCGIYEYIDGISLQSVITKDKGITDDIIVQAAKYLVRIHNTRSYSELGFFDDELNLSIKLPPFSTWYDLFIGENATKRLGEDIIANIRKLLKENSNTLHEIDRYYCLGHGDYRPANMLLDKEKNLVIVDWEFSGSFHQVSDPGQFFRYSDCFSTSHLSRFQTVYNSESKNKLPDNWYSLARLRDMVNLLQMINVNIKLPKKNQDLKNVILDTLNHFGY